MGVGGGGGRATKMTAPFYMGWSGTSADAVYAVVSLFCYIGGFDDLGDPVLPTLRRVSGDVETVCAY